jgi:hypothetical protein
VGTSKAVEKAEDFYLRLLTRASSTNYVLTSPGDDGLKSTIASITNEVLEHVRKVATDPATRELVQPERVVVVTIPHSTVQAVTVWQDPVHAIAVNHGLMLFMYRVARAISGHIIRRGAGDPPSPPESQTVSIIASLIDWMSSAARAPLIQDWTTGPREIQTAENLTTAGERFVVSHEIAHILNQHLIADAANVDISQSTPRDLDDRPYDEEIQADIGGAVLTIESLPDQGIDPRAGLTGIFMFLHSLHLAETVGAIVSDGKHPSAHERMDTLQEVLPLRFGDHFAHLASWAYQLDELMNRFGDAALAERQVRRKEAVSHMNKIFRESPAAQGLHRHPAEEKAMLDEVLRLLNTAPSAVLKAIADNLLKAEEYVRALDASNVPNETPGNDKWRRHTIAHFLARHLPPQVAGTLGVQTFTTGYGSTV